MHVHGTSKVQLRKTIVVVLLLVVDDSNHTKLARLLIVRINVFKEAKLCHHLEVRALASAGEVIFVEHLVELWRTGTHSAAVVARDIWTLVASHLDIHKLLHEGRKRCLVRL